MDDLKKACDESSKETKPESVPGNFIRRLLFANTASNTVIEKKIGATLLKKLREQGLAQGGAALNERKNRLHQLNPFVQCVVTEHMLRYVSNIAMNFIIFVKKGSITIIFTIFPLSFVFADAIECSAFELSTKSVSFIIYKGTYVYFTIITEVMDTAIFKPNNAFACGEVVGSFKLLFDTKYDIWHITLTADCEVFTPKHSCMSDIDGNPFSLYRIQTSSMVTVSLMKYLPYKQ